MTNKEYCREWRLRNPDYGMNWYRQNMDRCRSNEKRLRETSKSYRIRKAAQQRTRTAIKSGKIAPRPAFCTKCGRSDLPIHGHHPDYSKIEVEWLCRPCHVVAHQGL